MTRRDPLARHWRHPLIIQRYEGTGAFGDVWGQTEMIRGAIDSRTRMVRNSDGAEVVSSTTVALPLAVAGTPVAWIPPGSLATLPTSHGGRTTRVVDTQVGDGGGLPTPDHINLALE